MYLKEKLHECLKSEGHVTLTRSSNNNIEEPNEQTQVTACLAIQLLWVPPGLT